jgi:hypothetical protein
VLILLAAAAAQDCIVCRISISGLKRKTGSVETTSGESLVKP